jgi:hypothetical protein
MRFGGHETFPIREGWLNKGLRLLFKEPDKMTDAYFADWLGVGRNMGKAIKHWLVATGLAKTVGSRAIKKSSFECTAVGKLIYAQDPHFLELGTWWALHINLVNNPDYAYSWNWFFNSFNLYSQKLTKKLFTQLPEGLYLASNVHDDLFRSIFEENIAALDRREEQWKRIVSAGASQRIVYVFKTKEDYEIWLGHAKYKPDIVKKLTLH